jgi:hypothetical protein
MQYRTLWTNALVSSASLSDISSFDASAVGESLLVLMDFDSVHAIVMSHCARRAPHAVQAAEREFTLWKMAHQLAQHELQELARSKITAESRTGMSAAELEYTLAMVRSASLIKIGKELAVMDHAAITAYCENYPATLKSAAMDFSARWALAKQQRQTERFA